MESTKLFTKKTVAIMIVIIIILFSIWLGFNQHEPTGNIYCSIKIRTSGTGNFTVIVPFLEPEMDKSYWNRAMMENITISNASAEIIDTIYGQGLKIEGNQDCELLIEMEKDVPFQIKFIDDSITNSSLPNNPVFLFNNNSTNVSLYFYSSIYNLWKETNETPHSVSPRWSPSQIDDNYIGFIHHSWLTNDRAYEELDYFALIPGWNNYYMIDTYYDVVD